MLSTSDTAYPLLKENPTGRELQELFTPNLLELGFAGENTRQAIPRLGLLLLLKSFQKLGYFVRLAEILLPIGTVWHAGFFSPTRVNSAPGITRRS